MMNVKIGSTLAALAFAHAAFAHNFGDETVAFYAFDDGAAGTSAADVTLKNAIDSSLLPGRVEIKGDGSATFSDEAPGEYVFTNLSYTTDGAVFHNPKSIYLNSKTINNSNRATLFFDDLVKKAMELDACKIEFWYKLDANAKSGWEPGVFKVVGGWNVMSGETLVGTNGAVSLMLTSLGSATDRPQSYFTLLWNQVSDGAQKSSGTPYIVHPYGPLADGKWHHMVFEMPYNGTAKKFGFANDRQFNSRDVPSAWADGPADAARPLVLNPGGNFRGWISCVRLSKTVVSKHNKYQNPQNDYLWPSSLATCAPRAYARFRFEEQTAGESLTSVVTNLSTYNSYNPNIYYLPQNYLRDWRTAGRVNGPGEVIAYLAEEGLTEPTAEADVKKRKVLEDANDTKGADNTLSAKFVSPATETAQTVGYGLLMRVGTYLQPVKDPFTIEMFFKFDYEGWKQRIGTNVCRQVQLMWMTKDTPLVTTDQYNETIGIGLDLSNEKKPLIGVRGYTGTLTSGSSAKLIDGKWHHVAVTCEKFSSATATVNLWFDGEKLVDDGSIYYFWNYGIPNVEWDSALSADTSRGRSVWFARGDMSNHNTANAHCFHGLIDEARLSWGVLEPSEFMCQKNMQGMMVVVR